jgi:hypothetical protein
MARQSKIDQINDAFIKILTEENALPYAKYIKAIRKEMIDNADNLTASKVKQIIKGAKINIDNIVLLFTLQSAILLVLDKSKPRKSLDTSLLPIVALIGMYSLKRPERFVRKMAKLVKGRDLNARDIKAQGIIKQFKKDNATVLKDARRIARNQLDTSILKSRTSKNIQKDLRSMIKEKKSIKEIKSNLVRKYNSLSNVERALDTELHAQSEYVRRVHSEALGYTHKTWKTQGDKRVRTTHFHNGVKNKRVPINSNFRAGGLTAEQPGDTTLPPSDRIRCRCYLIYD